MDVAPLVVGLGVGFLIGGAVGLFLQRRGRKLDLTFQVHAEDEKGGGRARRTVHEEGDD